MPFKDPKAHREQQRIYMKRWRQNHPDKAKANCNRYYYRHKEERDKSSKRRSKQLLQKYRKIVIEHYGGKCVCCGETLIEFLTIDHPKGNGKEDRKRFRTSYSFYLWIIKNNFPEGYRILCYNCNCSIGHYGYCPHQKVDSKPQ